MHSFRPLIQALVVVTSLQASASLAAEPAMPPVSFHDPESDLRFTMRSDGRTLVITNADGGYLGVFDPLSDGDGGREGVVTAIRVATRDEMTHFKRQEPGPYVVLRYSTGGVVVVSVTSTAAVRPRRCGSVGIAVVDGNIACKIDLARARELADDAMIARDLVDGPTTITPFVFAIPCSDITLHVEADGRTVWAADASGTRLWTEDPFERAGVKPYRYRRPMIWTISPPATPAGAHCRNQPRPVVYLEYTSTQAGPLDVRTGRFTVTSED